MSYYKDKLDKEIFENIICLKFSNNIHIPKEIQCYITGFLNMDDIINIILKQRKTIVCNNYQFNIGKLNGFWFSNYFKPNLSYPSITKQKWDVFQVCTNCNYCKPLYHNQQHQITLGEYKNGFYYPNTEIKNRFTYLCKNCQIEI